MSHHEIAGQRTWEKLTPVAQRRITAWLAEGKWAFAKETLFITGPLHVRTVPKGEPFLLNHPLGTIYVELVNPEDFHAPREAMVEVRGVQWMDDPFSAEEGEVFASLTVRRDSLFGGPRYDGTNIWKDPYQQATDIPHFRYPV